MRVRATDIKPGSLHLRAIRQEHEYLKYPPYFSHVLLEPLGNHGAELKGLTNSENIKELLKLALQVAKSQGYWYVITTRVKNDEPRNTIYWLYKGDRIPLPIYAYACPKGCGCLWRDAGVLFANNNKSCAVCENLPLKKLIPLYFNRRTL